jgi:hypothetical protein
VSWSGFGAWKEMLERRNNFAGDSFAVGINLSMAWAPTFDKTVEVSPS